MTIGRNILIACLAFGVTSAAHGDSLRLRRHVAVETDAVRLADVAIIDGSRAEVLGDIVVATFDGRASTNVKLHDVRQLLGERNVNWGMLSLTGYSTCRVERVTPQQEQQVEPAKVAVPSVTNPGQPMDLTSAVTLRQRIEHYINENAGFDDLVITFSENDAAALDQPAFAGQYEFEPVSAGLIGRTPLIVRRWEGAAVAEQQRITAEVARRGLAVVAVRSLRRSATVQRGDVEIREVLLRDEHTQPLTSLDDVVGKTVSGLVRENAVVTDDDLRGAVMVRRGELMQVRCVSGAVVIKLKARASEEGELGQLITVRPEGRRGEIAVRVTGRGEGINVIGREAAQPSADGGFNFSTGRTAVR